MTAKELHDAARKCAEEAKSTDSNSLAYNEAVVSAFKTLKGDPKDFPLFKGYVNEHRQKMVTLAATKLPSSVKPAKN